MAIDPTKKTEQIPAASSPAPVNVENSAASAEAPLLADDLAQTAEQAATQPSTASVDPAGVVVSAEDVQQVAGLAELSDEELQQIAGGFFHEGWLPLPKI